MKFYSTKNYSNKVSFQKALLKGIPQDRGLYMPEYIPDFSKIFNQEAQLTFQELSLLIASGFLNTELSNNEIQNIIENSITFEAPNHNIYNNLYCLELFHGPTLAFKDFGARFMARCMQYFIGEAETEINILVATSGDTGSAVAHGFYDVEGINVIILYPKGKVSDIQEKQLTTLDKNIYALEIDGTFDDCQQLVKKAFLDKNLNSKLQLSSANSINIARLIPQSFYYAYSYLQLSNKNIPTIFSVPCGNFGNITAGLIAKKMGVPVDKFIASTNLNNVVPDYMDTGNYNPKESIQTISNAMDAASSGPSKAIAYRFLEGMGNTSREGCASLVRSLSQEERKLFAKLNVRLGQLNLFIPTMLKAQTIFLRDQLWQLHAGTKNSPLPLGRVAVDTVHGLDTSYYHSVGYQPLGSLALRVDMLERFGAMLRKRARSGVFEMDQTLVSLLGIRKQKLGNVLNQLGYRKVDNKEKLEFFGNETRISTKNETEVYKKMSVDNAFLSKKRKMAKSKRNQGKVTLQHTSPFAILRNIKLSSK